MLQIPRLSTSFPKEVDENGEILLKRNGAPWSVLYALAKSLIEW
jgi:hypothetical protein